MDDKQKYITHEEAIAMLPDGDTIHTFKSPYPGVMLGADWTRDEIIKCIKNLKPQLSGYHAASTNHALCVKDGAGYLFIETRKNHHE
jgi:hypothetical protein